MQGRRFAWCVQLSFVFGLRKQASKNAQGGGRWNLLADSKARRSKCRHRHIKPTRHSSLQRRVSSQRPPSSRSHATAAQHLVEVAAHVARPYVDALRNVADRHAARAVVQHRQLAPAVPLRRKRRHPRRVMLPATGRLLYLHLLLRGAWGACFLLVLAVFGCHCRCAFRVEIA